MMQFMRFLVFLLAFLASTYVGYFATEVYLGSWISPDTKRLDSIPGLPDGFSILQTRLLKQIKG